MTLADILERFGFPVAILAVIGFGVYRGVQFLGSTLLAPPTGLLNQLTKAHIDFLNEFKSALSSTTRALEEISTLLAELRDMREAERAELKVLLASKKEPDPP